jgi:putative OPT family oligopeptide transporter
MDQPASGAAKEFKPYVPPEALLPEFTLRAVLLGSVLGVIFGAASVYLGLKIGLTTTASIPIAVLAIGFSRGIRRTSILENNLIQTVGSAGESIAAAVVFTLPAMIFLGFEMEYAHTFLVALTGGLLGVLFMIPLRRYLIIKEHGKLPYPEGTACAEVLMVGESGGASAGKVIRGGLIGAAYKFLMGGLGLWQDVPTWSPRVYPGAELSAEVSPELMGVGYILGYRTSVIMVGGGLLSWLILIPFIRLFGETVPSPIYPGTALIRDMTPSDIWEAYIRYIGAGAVATGGLIGLVRALPTIWDSFRASAGQLLGARAAAASEVPRTERDTPIGVVAGGSLALVAFIWAVPAFHMNLLGALLIVVFGFFFSVVSSRITGIVGSSSCPISGMTIAALMGTCLLFVALGWTGHPYTALALTVGAIACIALSNAGTTSQDLKTGFLIGATPWKQQAGLAVGVLTSVVVIGWTMFFLNATRTTVRPAELPGFTLAADAAAGTETYQGTTYLARRLVGVEGVPDGKYLFDLATRHARFLVVDGIGSAAFPAPQSRLMAVVINGLLERRLPWGLVMLGVAIALFIELMGLGSLTFAVGVYLPLSSTAPIFLGGLARSLADRRFRREPDAPDEIPGTLFSSGLIAGGALVGILLAGLSGWVLDPASGRTAADAIAFGHRLLPSLTAAGLPGLAIFGLLGLLLFREAGRET